jgi:L-ascorbate metabolism protein UlaG (beta-lactamase superfamily)
MQATDHFNGKVFLNPVPTDVMKPGAFFRMTRKLFQKHPGREPSQPIGPFSADLNGLNHLPSGALRLTWLGHSTLLIETCGKRFLTDPVWYNRVSPFRRIGPKRFFQNPLPLSSLPPVDAVLLSHDHYDHLDKDTILFLCGKNIPVITLLGVGQRLRNWGASPSLITELDWWESTSIGDGFVVAATPSRHFSGRWIRDRFKTLWGAFAIQSPLHNIFFGADSGYYDGFGQIAKRLGPFDVAMLEIGAYNEEWEAIHMGPVGAVQAAIDLERPLLLPIHWATFNLALHPWKEPVERLLREAEEKSVNLLLPAPGETINIKAMPYNSRWWEKYR